MVRSFCVNVIGFVFVVKYMFFFLLKSGKSIFVVFLVCVGSIEDNWFGGWYGYCVLKVVFN